MVVVLSIDVNVDRDPCVLLIEVGFLDLNV
jgi:hypothetical protein